MLVLKKRFPGFNEEADQPDTPPSERRTGPEARNHAGCSQHNKSMPHLARCARNRSEVLAMTVGRFILAGQLHGDGACFEAAYEVAESVLDMSEAVDVVARVTCVVRSIRRERTGNFHFLPPNCCRLTPDEVNLLVALQAAIDGDISAFAGALALLTRGNAANRTAQAMSLLAETIGRVETRRPVSGRIH